MDDAQAVIARLMLQPHPEGGWYRETWRASPTTPGGRGVGTAILFLLEAGQRSHWHRVDATELWLFHAGAPLTLFTAKGEHGEGGMVETRLGPRILGGHQVQHTVTPHEWQAAQASDAGWSLVACVVAPAFAFEGFELAPPGWSPTAPKH